MSLNWPDLIALLAIALVVFLVGRVRPVINGATGNIKMLLDELSATANEREHWRELAETHERTILEQQADINALRRALREAQAAADFNRGRTTG